MIPKFIMKSLILLALTLTVIPVFAEATNPGAVTDPEEKPILDPTPYALSRYERLMSKSPFDFDVPPPPVVEAPSPFADWALAGITKSTDYMVAIMINMKTSERLRVTKYANPPSSKANHVKSGGDTYTLESITFEDGKASLLKYATATVTKNGTLGTVKFDAKVLTMKQAGAQPMSMGGRGGNMPVAIPNGANGAVPQPQGGNSSNPNQALLNMIQQRNAQAGGAQGQPNNGQPNTGVPSLGIPQPVNGAQPVQAVPQPTPTPAQPVVPQVFNNNATGQPSANPGFPGSQPNGQQPAVPTRRRVVLPATPGANPVPNP